MRSNSGTDPGIGQDQGQNSVNKTTTYYTHTTFVPKKNAILNLEFIENIINVFYSKQVYYENIFNGMSNYNYLVS